MQTFDFTARPSPTGAIYNGNSVKILLKGECCQGIEIETSGQNVASLDVAEFALSLENALAVNVVRGER